jgi:hypothetical protein
VTETLFSIDVTIRDLFPPKKRGRAGGGKVLTCEVTCEKRSLLKKRSVLYYFTKK